MKGCLNIAKIPVMFLVDINLLKWTEEKKKPLVFSMENFIELLKKLKKTKNNQSGCPAVRFCCSGSCAPLSLSFSFTDPQASVSSDAVRSEVSITPDWYTYFIISPDFHFEQIFILVMMHDGCFAASHLVFGHTSVHRVCVGKVVRDSNLISLISGGELLSFEGRVEHYCLQILDHLVGSIWVDLLVVVPRCEVRLD